MLLGVHHGGITVGDVQCKHADDLKKMVGEMMKLLEEEGVKFKPGLSHITEDRQRDTNTRGDTEIEKDRDKGDTEERKIEGGKERECLKYQVCR